MSRSIVSFSPHKTALTVSVLFALSSLMFVIPMALMVTSMPVGPMGDNSTGAAFSLAFVIGLPLLYLVFGYISTAIGALLYNLVAKFTGGIEVTVADSTRGDEQS